MKQERKVQAMTMFSFIVLVSHSNHKKHKWQELGSASGYWLVTHDNRRLPAERSLVPEISRGRMSSREDTALLPWYFLTCCVCMTSIQHTLHFPVILKEAIASKYPRRSVRSLHGNENVYVCINMGLSSPLSFSSVSL